jgi:HK97 family phage prohead protease
MLTRKTLSLSDVSLKLDGETGRFAGYASVFGGVDSYGDTIVKGAFESTLRNNGKPKMFFNHEWGMPIGKWLVAKEDDHGLYVEGELTLASSLGADVYAALKHGTLDGLSVGGFIKKGDYDDTEGGRVIRKWSVLSEVSPVAFPADGAARIDLGSVKSGQLADAIAEIETIRDFERFLRDAGGLTKGAAAALVARAKTVLGVEGEPDPQQAEAKALATVAEQLQRLQRRLAA